MPISRVLNFLTFGSPYELFCSRAYRRSWSKTVLVLNRFFHWHSSGRDTQHCRAAYICDKRHRRIGKEPEMIVLAVVFWAIVFTLPWLPYITS